MTYANILYICVVPRLYQKVLRASNLDPTAMALVTRKLEDVLDAKNAAIKDLQFELARACKAHNDVIRTYVAHACPLTCTNLHVHVHSPPAPALRHTRTRTSTERERERAALYPSVDALSTLTHSQL